MLNMEIQNNYNDLVKKCNEKIRKKCKNKTNNINMDIDCNVEPYNKCMLSRIH